MEARPYPLLFHQVWYESQASEIEGDPFEHFQRTGWRAKYDPHPLFDVAFYLKQLDQPLDGGQDPLSHFIVNGAHRGLNPHPLFDTTYYMTRYADSLGGLDPLTHYLSEGAARGYNPHPLFDSSWYLQTYGDVASSGMNPLLHYVVHGNEGWRRNPHPLFDADMYATRRGLTPHENPLTDFVLRLAAVAKEAAPAYPECAAVILNLNKSVLTLQCIVEALESEDCAVEVVVVDNGSRPEDFAFLADLCPPAVRLLRLGINRYFGEGNNIGAEASHAPFVLFLNNDAFLQPSTLRSLRQVFDEHPDAGAVGPKLVYPNGQIQEAGGFVTSDGTVTQRGKRLSNQRERYASTEIVDYVSAACLLMRRTDFDRIAGFDLAWDPAYYEDVDLCLKLLLIGKPTYYCGKATVVHIENATATDPSHGLALNTIVEVNREKFIARWGDFLDANRDRKRAAITLPKALAAHRPAMRRLAVLYTPYPLYPGGGERYLLTIAQALSRHYRTVIVTPERYSASRFRTIAEELELDLSTVELIPLRDITSVASCDLFIAMGNQVLPPLPAMGRRKLFICQFPLPMHVNHIGGAWDLLEGYDQVIVYSSFCAEHFRRRAEDIAHRVPPIAILAPPVPSYAPATPQGRHAGSILSVGRFTREGHCKRQDTMINAFRILVEAKQRDDLELHLVGTVPPDPEARLYLQDLRALAYDLPVHFHLNIPPSNLRELYQRSSLYWHAAGFMVWEKFFPERLEHFGISVVEAMSAGTLPLVCANGGPAEIVSDGITGFHWRSERELAEKSAFALDLPPAQAAVMRSAAQHAAQRFEPAAFEANFLALLDRWNVRQLERSIAVGG